MKGLFSNAYIIKLISKRLDNQNAVGKETLIIEFGLGLHSID
jgi:hypothetical protein